MVVAEALGDHVAGKKRAAGPALDRAGRAHDAVLGDAAGGGEEAGGFALREGGDRVAIAAVENLEEQFDLAAAALAHVGAENEIAQLRFARRRARRARPGASAIARHSSVPPPIVPVKPPSGRTIRRAPASRGVEPRVAATVTMAARPWPSISVEEARPDAHQISPPVVARIARMIASGVAGASRRGITAGFRLAIASVIAQKTEMREHQRRLAHRLGAIDRVLAVAAGIVAARRGNRPARRRRSGSCRSTARGSSAARRSPRPAPRVVSQPMPWTKPPSIWPISIAGLIDLPTSWRMSTRSTRISPVMVSTVTSEQAAP